MARIEIDFNQPILDLNDKPITGRDEDTGKEQTMTLGQACCNVLLSTPQGDKADGGEKIRRFQLAQKIRGHVDEEDWAVVGLTDKQRDMVVDLAAEVYSALMYSRIYDLIKGLKGEEDDEEGEEEG